MLWDSPLLTAVVMTGVAVAVAALITVGVNALLPARKPARDAVAPMIEPRTSWVTGLGRTRGSLSHRLLDAWRSEGNGSAWLARVEEILLSSDVGVKATRMLLDRLRPRVEAVPDAEALREVLKDVVCEVLANGSSEEPGAGAPTVILVVGVNGVGKTTTIGKLAHRYRQRGLKVLLVAADTFRAAAIEQLALWAERVQVGLVKHQYGADPSAVAFDGVKAAVARGVDIVIIDTAGRLHVKANLMEEMKKIGRTVGRQVAGAPHEVLLVIDATTGQNAINQARVFHEAVGVTGVTLTKLDGTAKGGVVLAIRSELGLPIRYVGLGERPEDLVPFDPEAFASALFPERELVEAS